MAIKIKLDAVKIAKDCPYGINSSIRTAYRLTVKDGKKAIKQKDYDCPNRAMIEAKRAERMLKGC